MRFLPTAVALALAAVLAAAPATANDTPGEYVALGDSYAAGTGTGPETFDGSCLIGPSAYPVSLAFGEGYALDFRACAGTDTFELADYLTYVAPLPEETDVVTLTIGGNDKLWSVGGYPLGWTDVLQQCLYAELPGGTWGSPGCRNLISEGPDMPGLSDRITGLVSLLSTDAPEAEIFVSGYPQLLGNFPTPTCTVGQAAATLVGFPAGEPVNVLVAKQDGRWLNQQATALNNAIRRGVNAAKAMGADVTFVDVSPAFNGHGLCDRSDAWVNGIEGLTVELGTGTPEVTNVSPRSFHLTAAGDAAYAERFLARGFGQ